MRNKLCGVVLLMAVVFLVGCGGYADVERDGPICSLVDLVAGANLHTDVIGYSDYADADFPYAEDVLDTHFPYAENKIEYIPLAALLLDFFADAIPAPTDWYGDVMPYSTHAVWVDLDGNGTVGVLASKWIRTQNGHARDVQYVFWQRDGVWHGEPLPTFFPLKKTAEGRLMTYDSIGACNISFESWTVFDVVDGALIYTTAITKRYYWSLGWMLGDEDDPDYLHIHGTYYTLRTYINGDPSWQSHLRTWEEIPLDEADFHGEMARLGFRDAPRHVWLWPDASEMMLRGR